MTVGRELALCGAIIKQTEKQGAAKTCLSCPDCSLDDISAKVPYPYHGNALSDPEKVKAIEYHFEQILLALGMDLSDDSLKKSPFRYAKMLVYELFEGLNDANFPDLALQENKFNYREMVIESNITITSMCEHHFVPILGYCHIAYMPKDKIIGLSKLNRIAHFFAHRPQVQERLTRQIKESLVDILETADVAVVLDAAHLCVRMRGVEHSDALTRTADYGGKFNNDPIRLEFLQGIPRLSDIKL